MIDAPLNSPDVYTDNKALSELKLKARENSPEAVRAVAQQFEALFLQTMLKEARSASSSLGGGLLDSQQTEMYQDLFDKQIALQLSASEGRGIGLAEVLERQLMQMSPAAASESTGDGSESAEPAPMFNDLERPIQSLNAPANEARAEPPAFESPQAFVEELWPMARDTAQKLGVDPRVLVAQAALETGWGQAVNRHPDGRSSHNLFNIKADGRWDGERVNVNTLEFRDGVARRERADFRAYDSYAESFEDYARFLTDNPRYREALTAAEDARGYTEALQQAGYATDPDYSAKIMRIAGQLDTDDHRAGVKLS